MPVALSSRETRALQAAIAGLLSPLDYTRIEAWLAASSRQLAALLGADQALAMVPLATGGGAVMTGCAYDLQPTVTDYLGVMAFDTGLHVKRGQLGLEVYHQRHVYDLAAFHRNPVYGDWAVPHRLMDVIGMGYNPVAGEAVAAMHFYHDKDHGPEDSEVEGAFGPRGLALLRFLLPAWKAGVRQYLTFGEHREGLGQLLDTLEEGVALYDMAGRERHRNSALRQLLAEDPRGAELALAIEASAQRVARACTSRAGSAPNSPMTLAEFVSTAKGVYAVEVSKTGLPTLGAELTIVVTVRRRRSAALTNSELAARYHLTSRECEVAALLAAGRSNVEVASVLGITHHTARRHTEGVLRKLGVPSRAAVGSVIRGDIGGPDPLPPRD